MIEVGQTRAFSNPRRVWMRLQRRISNVSYQLQ